jgi:hypothetical protein
MIHHKIPFYYNIRNEVAKNFAVPKKACYHIVTYLFLILIHLSGSEAAT